MIVVDSTTLIALARIRRLDLLKIAFRQIVVPESVYEELVVRGAGKPGSAEIRDSNWIEVRSVKDREKVVGLQQSLGKGESEAIVLAKEQRADLLILDDLAARKCALQEGLVVIGTLGPLKRLRERGILPALKPLLDELKASGFYMGAEYEELLRQVGEL